MRPSSLLIMRVGSAVVQDLGRPGWARIGIPANGALDQHSHRCANLLVGNAEGAPSIEITGSELVFLAETKLLIAVTGAANTFFVDEVKQLTWEPTLVFPGSRVRIPTGARALRSYLSVNGQILADLVLGSVSPDHLLGVSNRLLFGDRVLIDSAYTGESQGTQYAFFRLGIDPPPMGRIVAITVTPGPELSRTTLGEECLRSTYTVSEQSDHIGLRLLGPDINQTSTSEILSRGVPVGAVEAPPTGGVIVLLRGRLVTAGYPVVGVATTTSLDRLGQARPGDTVAFTFTDVATARIALEAEHRQRAEISAQVRRAFCAAGIGHILEPKVQ